MKPMLAATLDDFSLLKFPLLASPKLDGIRATIVDGVLVSRKLLPIPNHWVRQSLSHTIFNGLDGELVCGRPHADDAYRRTMSSVMSREGEPAVTFWVFDNYLDTRPFYKRLHALPVRKEATESAIVRRLAHVYVNSGEELLAYERLCVGKGYEGIMLRDPYGRYKFGRSTQREGGLMKLKRFEDGEAEILGVVEQNRNDNEATVNALGRTKRSSHKANKTPKGTTGALQVRDLVTRVEFEIGTGLDDTTRQTFWDNPPLGQVARYKFQPSGVKDKPRFPVFLGLRSPDDM